MTHTHTHRQTDASDLIICPMLCYSNGTDNDFLNIEIPRKLLIITAMTQNHSDGMKNDNPFNGHQY